MATTNDVKKRVFFTRQEDFDTLVSQGQVTIDGVTYFYSPSDTDYFTPDTPITVVQSTGQSTASVMSQKAVTDALAEKRGYSVDFVEQLPQSDIDEDTYYLTKKGIKIHSIGNYISDEATYPTDNLPPWTYSINNQGQEGNEISFIVYNPVDGNFYYFNKYSGFSDRGGYNSDEFWFGISGDYFYATKGGGYHGFGYYVYNTQNNTWTKIWSGISTGSGTYKMFPVSTDLPFKFVWVSGNEECRIVSNINAATKEVIGRITNDTTKKDTEGYIYADFFTKANGEYKNNDTNNTDPVDIQEYDINIYNNGWSVIGTANLVKGLEGFAKTKDVYTKNEVNSAIEAARPSINGVLLNGNKSGVELKLRDYTILTADEYDIGDIADGTYLLKIDEGETLTIDMGDYHYLDNTSETLSLEFDDTTTGMVLEVCAEYAVTLYGIRGINQYYWHDGIDDNDGTPYWTGGSLLDIDTIASDLSTYYELKYQTKGNVNVDNLENGIYHPSSNTGQLGKIRVNVKGTVTSYSHLNCGYIIKTDNRLLLLTDKVLVFNYDSTNQWYEEPIDLSNISGGGSDSTFWVTYGEQNDSNLGYDKTYDEIVAAINAGKEVRAKLKIKIEDLANAYKIVELNLDRYNVPDINDGLMFSCVQSDWGVGISIFNLVHSTNNEIAVERMEISSDATQLVNNALEEIVGEVEDNE